MFFRRAYYPLRHSYSWFIWTLWRKCMWRCGDAVTGCLKLCTSKGFEEFIIFIATITTTSTTTTTSLIIGLFFLVLPLLNHQWSPPLRLQLSDCSTCRIMCDVWSVAVFCSECIYCFPAMASTFLFKSFVTFPVAPMCTGIITHFMFHIRCISVHKLLYFSFFFSFLLRDIPCPLVFPPLSLCVFSLFCF